GEGDVLKCGQCGHEFPMLTVSGHTAPSPVSDLVSIEENPNFDEEE
ncbi:MAG: hypothetical protein GOV15_01195, partial [Candidatus Diapherotrites archaeon]|nr:hypothetical protein [Candidatus Diapherotrites archaeon]